MFDAHLIKKDFPIFSTHRKLVYLDSTATSLKPHSVLAKEREYYERYCANIFRGVYKLSEQATAEYEAVRKKIAQFIGASDEREIVFVRNTTEAINLVAAGIGKTAQKNDEFVVSIMEHHSNFVPWQQRALKKSIKFKIWNLSSGYHLDLKDLDKLINKKTKVLAITAVSNVLGTISPIPQIVKAVKKINPTCLVVVDAAQAIPHMSVDVGAWGADFIAFSGHKMLGLTGVGVLWGRYELLQKMPPYQYGGEMIAAVYKDHSEFKDPPHKFEAGTPHIAGVIGLGAAVDYLQKLGMENVRQHEMEITEYALEKLQSIEEIKIIGPVKAANRGGVIAFTLQKAHAHDIAQILDSEQICIRSGHHCAMPLHIELGLAATARASFYVYTTKEDVDRLIIGLRKVISMLS